MNPPLIMPLSAVHWINLYWETLHLNASGDEQGSRNLRQGQMGDGGQAASGETSVTSSPTIIGGGGGEKAVEARLEQFTFKTSHGILVLEGIDEDAEGADATMRDELIMTARNDPVWMEELRRYLQEKKRRENRCRRSVQ